MLVYLRALFGIAMRKLGPEDLPDSGFLLGLTLVAYIVLQLPLALAAYGPSSAIVTSLGATVLIVAIAAGTFGNSRATCQRQ